MPLRRLVMCSDQRKGKTALRRKPCAVICSSHEPHVVCRLRRLDEIQGPATGPLELHPSHRSDPPLPLAARPVMPEPLLVEVFSDYV